MFSFFCVNVMIVHTDTIYLYTLSIIIPVPYVDTMCVDVSYLILLNVQFNKVDNISVT